MTIKSYRKKYDAAYHLICDGCGISINTHMGEKFEAIEYAKQKGFKTYKEMDGSITHLCQDCQL